MFAIMHLTDIWPAPAGRRMLRRHMGQRVGPPVRVVLGLAIALLAAAQAGGAWARGGSGGSGSGHGGHSGGAHPSHPIGYPGVPVFVARRLFYAPVAYYPGYYGYYSSGYYEPPPAYYPPPVAYYPQPEPIASYTPPPPPRPVAPPEPASQAPIFQCKDASGRTIFTNRSEEMAGKDCRMQSAQGAPAASAAKGPYAAQDALLYRYFCPESRKYYPEVNNCASAWLKVVPDAARNYR